MNLVQFKQLFYPIKKYFFENVYALISNKNNEKTPYSEVNYSIKFKVFQLLIKKGVLFPLQLLDATKVY